MSRFFTTNRALLTGIAAGAVAGYALARSAQAPFVSRTRAPHDARVYGALRRRFALAGLVRSTLATLAFSYGPTGKRLSEIVEPLPAWLAPGAFAAVATALGAVAEFPISVVEEYQTERRYELTTQSLRSYTIDAAKSTAIELLVTGLLAVGAAFVVRRYPRTWPWIASSSAFALYALANLIVPVYILPLFNRFEKLEGPLETRLRALAARYGVGDAEILTMDMSKQTKKANAFVTGIGNTHRIVLGDTLLDGFEPEEIEFVVAHELGHYVHRDTWRLIAAAGCATALLLAAAAFVVRRDRSSDAVRLARITAIVGVGSNLLRPALAAFSRSREWSADRFAVEATHDPRAGAAAFARLRDQNLAEDEIPAWFEFFFGTHPSLGKRIAALRDGIDDDAAGNACYAENDGRGSRV